MRALAGILVLLLGGQPGATEPLVAHARRGVVLPAGEVLAPEPESLLDGVGFRSGDKVEWMGWDRIAAVEGLAPELAARVAPLADKAWRARIRLEREDVLAAEPVYEDLFRVYESRRGATACAVGEGLLRCRLRRGAQAAAVDPWLAWVRASDPSTPQPRLDITSPPSQPPLIDPGTGLCPALPPVWLNVSSTQAMARRDPPAAGGGKRAQALAELYRLAAGVEVGLVTEAEASALPVRSPDPALSLVAQIVAARGAEAGKRKEARQMLLGRLAQRMPAWEEAWVRVGIGRSLLQEPEAEDRLIGLAHLLHVPARLRAAQPYLAGVALAEAALAQARAGNAAAAYRLKREIMEGLPGHPALDMEALAAIGSSPARGKGQANRASMGAGIEAR